MLTRIDTGFVGFCLKFRTIEGRRPRSPTIQLIRLPPAANVEDCDRVKKNGLQEEEEEEDLSVRVSSNVGTVSGSQRKQFTYWHPSSSSR